MTRVLVNVVRIAWFAEWIHHFWSYFLYSSMLPGTTHYLLISHARWKFWNTLLSVRSGHNSWRPYFIEVRNECSVAWSIKLLSNLWRMIGRMCYCSSNRANNSKLIFHLLIWNRDHLNIICINSYYWRCTLVVLFIIFCNSVITLCSLPMFSLFQDSMRLHFLNQVLQCLFVLG